jgi:WD40 repeat protein
MLDNSIKLWDLGASKKLPDLEKYLYPVDSVAFSPDGTILASGGNELVLWNLTTRRKKATIPGHVAVKSVAFSPDGKMLASAGVGSAGKDTIQFWDVAGAKTVAELRGHTAMIHCLCFSPDGKLLASGSADNSVKLWDVAGARELATLSGHTGWVYCLAFSPDGKTLASGGVELKIWDVAGRKEKPGTPVTQPPSALAFSPDGKTLAVAAGGGFYTAIALWDVAN